MAPMSFDLTTWATQHRAQLDAFLHDRYRAAWPPAFDEALRYPVFGGGKRVRPLLTLAAARALLGPEATLTAAYHAAWAVELIHTYSLVHDDLPAMDDDDMRRGRPTVHRAYDEATAILTGDALLTDAFRLLTEADLPPHHIVDMVRRLTDAAGHKGMIGGQVADIRWSMAPGGLDALTALHAGKTGALIRCAVELGAVCAHANDETLTRLADYGRLVGMAFQLADDVLDAEEDEGDDGPPSFVKLLGEEETTRRAHQMAHQAIDAVRDLPCPDALIALAHFTVERTV